MDPTLNERKRGLFEPIHPPHHELAKALFAELSRSAHPWSGSFL